MSAQTADTDVADDPNAPAFSPSARIALAVNVVAGILCAMIPGVPGPTPITAWIVGATFLALVIAFGWIMLRAIGFLDESRP